MATEVGTLTCKIAPVLADGADGEHTGALIVALPAADDGIAELVQADPHVTLAYFGDAAGLPDVLVQALGSICRGVAGATAPFTAKVNGKAALGDDAAKVLLLESPELSDLHTGLVSTGPVQMAQAGTEQYPEFIPHLTVDYGDTVDGLPDTDDVTFDRIGLWIGDDRQDFELTGAAPSFAEVNRPPTAAAALTAAGTRTFDPSLHPRGPDGRFIRKWGIAKWVDKKTKKWGYGKVVGWAKHAGSDKLTDVTLSPTDVTGTSLGQPDVVKSSTELYEAPKVLAHLKKDDPSSKKTGGQAGSNPGGFYELGVPVEADTPGTNTAYAGMDQATLLAQAKKEADEAKAKVTEATFANTQGNELAMIVQSQAPAGSKLAKQFEADQKKALTQAKNQAVKSTPANKIAARVKLANEAQGQVDFYQNQINNPPAYYTPQMVENVKPNLKNQSDYLAQVKAEIAGLGGDLKALFPGDPAAGPDVVPAKYYVKKARTPNHGKNEQLANDLYAAAGVPVPMVDYDPADGMIYSKLVGGKHDMTDHLHDEQWLTQVRRNFAVDAWLANWDVFGLSYDNVQTDANGVVWRIDSGGALLYRAMGGPKGADFGPEVKELKTLRTKAANKPVFGPGMSPEDELDGAQRVLAITPGQIKDMVADVGLSPSVADTLIARRKYIADHYKLDLPETLKTPDTDLEATAAPLIEPADLAKSKGLSRDWQPLSLTEAAVLMRQGDRLRLPDGTTVTVGHDPDTGKPVDIIGQQNQMNWLTATYGGGADVHLNTVTKGQEKPRPEHGAVLKAGQVQAYRWQRGDRLMTEQGPVRVHGVAANGTYALVSAGDGAPYTLALTGSKDYTVIRWDAPATQVDIAGDEVIAPAPPKTNTFGLAPAAQAALQGDLAVPQSAVPGAKSMTLGDGTKASTGNSVLSKMDGKLYVFIKPKGPYAVVTDPNSEHPDEQLLKMASTMAQPGAPKGDLVQPKSANGIIPSVGMAAKAKDGHEGTITMVSPDGKFVFITDSAGKKKRKSVGTVTISSMPEPAQPVDTAPEYNEPPPVPDAAGVGNEADLAAQAQQALAELPLPDAPTPEPELADWEKELLEAATTGPFITDDAAAPWYDLPLSKGDKVSNDGGQTWQTVHAVSNVGMVTAEHFQTFYTDDPTPFMHQPKALADGDAPGTPEGAKVTGPMKDLDVQAGDWVLDDFKAPPVWVQIDEVEGGWAKGSGDFGKASWYLNSSDTASVTHGPNHISPEAPTAPTASTGGVFDGVQTDPDTDKVIAIHSTTPGLPDSHWVQHEPGGDWHLIQDGALIEAGVNPDLIEKPGNFDYDVVQEPGAPAVPAVETPNAPAAAGVAGSDYQLQSGEHTVAISTKWADDFTVVYTGGDGTTLLQPTGAVYHGKFYANVEDLPIDTTPVAAKKFSEHTPKVKAGDILSPDGFNWYLVEKTEWKKKAGGKFNLTHYQVRSLTSGQTTEWNWHSAPTVRWAGQSGVHPPNPDGAPKAFGQLDLQPGDQVQVAGWADGAHAGEQFGQTFTVKEPNVTGGWIVTDANGKDYSAGPGALGFKTGSPEAPAVDTTPEVPEVPEPEPAPAVKGVPSGVTGIEHAPKSFADLPDDVQDYLRKHPNTTVVQLTPVKDGQQMDDQFYLLDPSPDATGTLLFYGADGELKAPMSQGKPVPNGPAGVAALQKAVDAKLAAGQHGHAAWSTLADVTPDSESAPKDKPDQPTPLTGKIPELPGGYQLPPGHKAYKIVESDGEETWVVQVDTSGNPLMPQGMVKFALLEETGPTVNYSLTEQQLLNSYDADQLTEYIAPDAQITPKSWGEATETVTGTPLSDYSKSTLAALDGTLQPGDKVYQRTYSDGSTLVMVGRADGYHHVYNDGVIDPAPVGFTPSALEEIAGPDTVSTPATADEALADLAQQLAGPAVTPDMTGAPDWLTVTPEPGVSYGANVDNGQLWKQQGNQWVPWVDAEWNPDLALSDEEWQQAVDSGDVNVWAAPGAVDPTVQAPAVPTLPVPTPPPAWLDEKGIPGVDPLPGATYVNSFGTVWRKAPGEEFYRMWDGIYDMWDSDVTASQADIDEMKTNGAFSEWTAPDPATIAETGDVTAAEYAGISVTGGDIVVQGVTGYLMKFNGQGQWHTYNQDGLEDKTVSYSDDTAQWALEHAGFTVVYGTFGGQSAPAGAGTAGSTGAAIPSMPVTGENAYIHSNVLLSDFAKGKIQNYLDMQGGLPPGKVLVLDGSDLYEADADWTSGGPAKYVYGGGTTSGLTEDLGIGKVVQWDVPGSSGAVPVDTTAHPSVGGQPIVGWNGKIPDPTGFTPGTSPANLHDGDWVFIPPGGTAGGPGYFAQVTGEPTWTPGAAQFTVTLHDRYEVAPDGTLGPSLPTKVTFLPSNEPWYQTSVVGVPQPPEPPGPKATEAPTYPGSAKPTAAEVSAWGSDLTKDGYIPAVGMHVTGKGPMKGMIVSVNPTSGMAKVKTSDGKFSSRKVSALSVDVAANYVSYAPKAVTKDIPAGMALAIPPPGQAIATTFATGKHHALVSDAPGVRNGMISMMRAKTPAGDSVVRVNLTLTKDQAKALVAKLEGEPGAAPAAPKPVGGWKKLSTDKSQDVAVGMKFAMKKTNSQGWLSDKAQTKPDYTVTSVDWNADKTQATVGMKHDNGDVIEATFKPGFDMIHYEWDPTIMPPPPPPTPGHAKFTLSAAATAQGWKHVKNEGVISAIKGNDATGNGVLDVTPGQMVPVNNCAVEFLGSTEGLRKTTADGVVIEVMRPNHTANPNSWNGVTAITLPKGADETMLQGALDELGIAYAPMTQETAKKHARALLKSSFKFDKSDVDSPGNLTDADLFKIAASTFGISDIGWQDVHMGVDETVGKTTFFWSERVRGAIAAKSKHNLVIRNGQSFQDNAAGIASNLLFGGVGGVQKRLTGMVYRTSGNMASHDAQNMANEGTFSSITSKTQTLPTKNPHWGDWGFTVYHRPEAVLGRIGDIRAGHGDAFGDAGSNTNSVERALNTKEHQDYYIGGGTPPGSIAYIGVKSETRRQETIAYLAARGVTHIEGRPVADILILTSESHKYQIKDLPPAKEPANSRPILDLPAAYPPAGEGDAAGEAAVTAAVDTEAAA